MLICCDLAWKALQSINAFWKSYMSRKLQTKNFRTAVELVLYGAETWTLKKADTTAALDGVYTRIIRIEEFSSSRDNLTHLTPFFTEIFHCSATPFLITILWPSV